MFAPLSDADLHQILDHVSDVLIVQSVDARIVYVTPSVTPMFGWTPAEILGMPSDELWHADDLADSGALRQLLDGTEMARARARMRCKDGTYRWVEITGRPISDELGRPKGIVSIARDVELLVTAEQALLASHEQYRLLAEHASDVVLQTDLDQRILWVSESVSRALGWEPKLLVGTPLAEILHPQDRPHVRRVHAGLSRSATATGSTFTFLARFHTRPGAYVSMTGITTLVAAHTDHARYAVTGLRDVQDLVTQRELTKTGATLLRATIDSVQDPHVILEPVRDEAGRITDFTYVQANALACEVNQRTHDELIGSRLVELHPAVEASGLLRDFARVMESGTPLLMDDVTYSDDTVGRGRHFEIRAMRVGHYLSQTWRDVTERHRANRALAESEERFRLAMTHATIGMALVSPAGQFMLVNPALCAMLGRDSPDLITRTWPELTHPDDVEVDQGLVRDILAGRRDSFRTLKRYVRPDSTLVWGDLSVSCIRNDDGSVRTFIAQIVDVTEQVSAREEIERAEHRFRLLAENAMDLVISLDLHERIQWISPSVEPFIGYPPGELTETPIAALVHPDDAHLLESSTAAARAGAPTTCRVRMRRRGGTDRWVEAAPRNLYDDAHQVIGSVIGVRDIDAEVRAHEALQREVDFDALTGLAKRPLALARIQQILDSRGESGWALLCLGLHGMTSINQAFTYSAGDEVLREVAQRLALAAGGHDRVARIAGDEFLILSRDTTTPADAVAAAIRLLACVQDPVPFRGDLIDVSASVGIVMANEHRANELMRDASAAMHLASAKGRNGWEFLDRNVGEETRRRLNLQASLRAAIQGGRLRAWYMPIISLHDGALVGYEALVRWIEDGEPVLSPVEYLEIAERTSMIQGIDRLMLTQVVGALADDPSLPHVGVNISAVTLGTGALAEWVHDELDRSRIDPRRLHLEVTETDLFHVTDHVRQTMQTIADLGVSWWVDDFGTGFSSLSHLRDLPISGLKLDRSFTSRLTAADDSSAQLARGLAGLADGLDLQTIAEGVETPEQARILADQGWQMGQGWLYGKAESLPVG